MGKYTERGSYMKVRLKEDIGSGAVYEGRFLDPSDAKTFTEQLNQKAGGSMEVIFNLNRGRDMRYVL